MAPLIDELRHVFSAPRGADRPVCMVCGRGVAPQDERVRVRGDDVAHRGCATYSMRRKRTGTARLGYRP